MPDASAVATPPAAAPVVAAPAKSDNASTAHPDLGASLDTILAGSDLGKPESEQRVSGANRGRRGPLSPPRAPAAEKSAAGADKTVEATTNTAGSPPSAPPATTDTETGSEAKTAEQAKVDAVKAGEEKKKDPGPWTRTHTAEKRVKELEAKLKEFESRPKTDDPEKLEWVKRHDELDKKYKELDEQVRYIDYTKSSEFQEKHYKPYVEQYQESAAKMMSWRGVGEDGTPREITAKDFERFMGIGDEDEAEAFASKLLGSDTKTARAMTLRDSIVAAEKNMRKVADEFRKTGAAKQQEQAKLKEAQEKVEYEQAVAQWDNLNKGALEKYPDWFTAPDDDEKGKEFLKIGYDNVDKALGSENGMPREEILARRAAVRNQAGAFRYMVHKWETVKNRLAEVEKELAAFKDSEPGKGQAAGGKTAPTDDAHASIDASIARMAGR